jgi:DNA-binding Lrp family transcriptional regulator
MRVNYIILIRVTPLEDIDARILQVLESEPWPSVRMIVEFLKIPASTVHLHLTTSLNMKAGISNGFLIFLMMI